MIEKMGVSDTTDAHPTTNIYRLRATTARRAGSLRVINR